MRVAKAQILALWLVVGACGGTQAPPAPAVASAPANGWGDDIAWRPLAEGLEEARQRNVPLMVVIHTSWCSKCSALKRSTFRDPQLAALSEGFVMVNLDQDHEPRARELAPDGEYIPRVVFLAPDGRLDEELGNPRPSRYRYFYLPQDDLMGTMRRALERHAFAT